MNSLSSRKERASLSSILKMIISEFCKILLYVLLKFPILSECGIF